MNEIRQLEAEHINLRHELNAATAALNAGNRLLLRDIICLIEERLEEHIQREGEAFKCGQSVLKNALSDKGLDHHSSLRAIKAIKKSLENRASGSVDQVDEEVGKFIARLRRQVVRQEAEVFPVLEPLWMFRRPQGGCEIMAG